MSTTVHLKASDLRALLRPVMPLADQDPDMLPVLNAVWLRTTKTHITATATDRYRLGMQRVTIKDAPKKPLSAILGLREAKSILNIFKPTRVHDPELALTFTDDKVTVAATGGIGLLLEGSLSWRLVGGEYPHVDSLVAEAFATEDGEVSAAAINPVFLADFRHAKTSVSMPMIVRTRKNKPWAIQIGDDFIGIINSARADDATLELGSALERGGWVLETKPEPKKGKGA